MLENILQNWQIDNITSIKKVETGLLNQTFIVYTENNLYVLQSLHKAVSLPGCTENYFHVTQFLLTKGYICQQVIPTINKQLTYEFNNEKWRLLQAVPGDVYTVTPNREAAFEAGKLLARFHVSLKDYSDELQPTLPMFQYNQVLEKLLSYETQFINGENYLVAEAYNTLSTNFAKLLLPIDLPQSVIHTDPKISNFLFDDHSKGICMIDLDTIQKLSPLYDIGDCVRSICGMEEDDPNNQFNLNFYQAIIQGYLENNSDFSKRETDLIPQACQLVMLGLAARFLNDYIDDNYFGWDNARYPSRRAHNLARAIGQIKLWESFMKQT
jgi:Ser/Thr protein kinase RdoA (MazF antagonist)